MTITAATKAHGTGNDFVLIEDRTGELSLTADDVRRLTDRRRGIGADGVIRVVPSALLGEDSGALQAAEGAEWFMDYRNADGSIAEMCGNGVRVFAHYLRTRGLVSGGGPIRVGTRAGVRSVEVIADPLGGDDPWYRVSMGAYRMSGAVEAGADSLVRTAGVDVARPGISVDMGNPHTVVALADATELITADLAHAPEVEPRPPHGTNVEFIVVEPDFDDDPDTGRLSMRVHERGVGETLACGTGACAAAIAARFWAGEHGPHTWRVDQPGGAVRIEISGDTVTLAGPAVLVAELTLL